MAISKKKKSEDPEPDKSKVVPLLPCKAAVENKKVYLVMHEVEYHLYILAENEAEALELSEEYTFDEMKNTAASLHVEEHPGEDPKICWNYKPDEAEAASE